MWPSSTSGPEPDSEWTPPNSTRSPAPRAAPEIFAYGRRAAPPNALFRPIRRRSRSYVIAARTSARPEGKPAPPRSEPIGPLARDAGADAGKADTKFLSRLPDLREGRPNGVGPNLYAVVGDHTRRAAAAMFYARSRPREALDYQQPQRLPRQSEAFVPGTKMTFAGLPRANHRADIIAYSDSLTDHLMPPPTAA